MKGKNKMAEETVTVEQFNELKKDFDDLKKAVEASKQQVWVSGQYLGKNYDCYGPINAPYPMTTNVYPFVITAPDESMKHPRYDYEVGKWVDRSGEFYEEQVTELSNKIDSFTEQTTKTVTALQQSQVITVQQSTELSKSLEAFKGSQEATNKTLQQLTMMVSQLAKPANNETTDKN